MIRNYLQKTPHIAIAIIGFSCALIVLEIQRIPTIGYVNFSIFAPLPYFIEVLVLLIFSAFYMRFPQERVSDTLSIRVVLSILTVIFAGIIVYQTKQGSDMQSLITQSLYRTTSALFLLLWGERLLPLGAKRVALTFAGSCILSGIILLGVSFVEINTARLLVLSLPTLSGICFIVYKPILKNSPGTADHASKSLEEKLPYLPCDTPKEILFSLGLLCLPLLCRAPVVSVQSSWITAQGNTESSLLMQISISAGIICAGLISYFVIKYAWNRNYILVYELFVLPVTFLAFYVSQASADLWFIYLFIVDTTYKTTLFFLFLSPFMFPETRNPLLPLLLSFAFMIFARSCFSALYLQIPLSAFTIIAIIVICATFIGGGLLSFLMLQRSNVSPQIRENTMGETLLENACLSLAKDFDLTAREAEILLLLAQKYNAPYIAKKLVVSQSTVKTHMRNIYAKLEIHSQTELYLLIEEVEENSDIKKAFLTFE